MESKRKKVCFAASSGGHWEELMCLRPVFEKHDVFFVTEEGGQASDCEFDNMYVVPQINRREKKFIFKFLSLFAKASKIMKKERPDAIVTTGALVTYPLCVCAKLRGAKIIYIESFARVNNKSLTGKLIYPIADLFLVQWETMLECYPKAKYVGGIF